MCSPVAAPMHRAAVIGNNRDGAMAMKNLPATSHVSFQCAHLQPYPSDGQMSEISPEGSIGTSVSVTSNVAYPSAVDSRCHTSDHDAAVRESMAERPALSLPSEASCSSQSSHDDSLEVFVSGARARTGPAISSFVAPKAPSQTHGDEYELVPVISTTIKALATTFTSSREMDSEGSNVASALSENPSPDSGSEMLYDVPLDAERWMKYRSRISSYSNHECCGQLGDQPAAVGKFYHSTLWVSLSRRLPKQELCRQELIYKYHILLLQRIGQGPSDVISSVSMYHISLIISRTRL